MACINLFRRRMVERDWWKYFEGWMSRISFNDHMILSAIISRLNSCHCLKKAAMATAITRKNGCQRTRNLYILAFEFLQILLDPISNVWQRQTHTILVSEFPWRSNFLLRNPNKNMFLTLLNQSGKSIPKSVSSFQTQILFLLIQKFWGDKSIFSLIL